MKIELKVLIYSMINNLVIALGKVIGGVLLGLGSLLADGLHTFCDFVTDVICMISSNFAKKKPTKYHPYGFGRIDYLTNVFIGVLLFALGLFIIIHSIGKEVVIPPLGLLWLLIGAIVLKLIAIFIMHIVGKRIKSQVLITSVEESSADLISSIGVLVITILLQFSKEYEFLKYSDMIGSILIGLFVIYTAFKIIIMNSLSIIGEVEEDEEVLQKVLEYLKEFKSIENQKIALIKYGAYYKLQLVVEMDPSLTLRQVSRLERKIKRGVVRHHSLHIKYVTIYVTDKIEDNM